ncbi:hypothetical protein EI94DRAFT_1806029 [Lactarius quietus]|nr:hypothetical protein EI94DRAFT_1806029 [Lactarius quietus]
MSPRRSRLPLAVARAQNPHPPLSCQAHRRAQAPLTQTIYPNPQPSWAPPNQGLSQPGKGPFLPSRRLSPPPPQKKGGPLTTTPSIPEPSASNPLKAHVLDIQALKRLSEDDKARIDARLGTLRTSSNKILAGVTNFYNHADLIPTGDRSSLEHDQDEETINTAFKIMLVALDAGFPNPVPGNATNPVLEGSTWARAVTAMLAVIGRGMIRSSPDRLKVVADNPFTPTDACLKLETNLPGPRTDGELIQHLAEQIAGLVNNTNDHTKEASTLTFFNSIKETARKGLEEGAELQARVKVDEWRSQLVLQLKSASFGEIAESLLSELKTNPFQADRHLAIVNEILPVMNSLKEIAITKAREDTRKRDEDEIRAVVEKEQACMHKEETEKVQREVSCDVSQEVRNWRIAHKEKQEKEFQTMLDAEVKATNKIAVIKAARDLGLSPSDLIAAPGGTASPGRPLPKPPSTSMGPPPTLWAGSKRTASGNAVSVARVHTPAQTTPRDVQDDSTPAVMFPLNVGST